MSIGKAIRVGVGLYDTQSNDTFQTFWKNLLTLVNRYKVESEKDRG